MFKEGRSACWHFHIKVPLTTSDSLAHGSGKVTVLRATWGVRYLSFGILDLELRGFGSFGFWVLDFCGFQDLKMSRF